MPENHFRIKDSACHPCLYSVPRLQMSRTNPESLLFLRFARRKTLASRACPACPEPDEGSLSKVRGNDNLGVS